MAQGIQYLRRACLPPLAFVRRMGNRDEPQMTPSILLGHGCGETSMRSPGALFCSGYMSSMDGQKAVALEDHLASKGHSYVRFDYTNTGKSVGEEEKTREISFKQWTDDVLTMVDTQTQGPLILIGSSMGCWMSLIAALKRPERVKGLLLIAPAVDFMQAYFQSFPSEKKEKIEKGETVLIEGPQGSFLASRRMMDEAKEFEILSRPGKIPISCPVRIVHGMLDDATPYKLGLKLCDRFQSNDVEIVLRKSGEHRLSTPHDISILRWAVDSLLNAYNTEQ